MFVMMARSQSSSQNCLLPTDLWHWLVDHSVPGTEIEGKPHRFLLDLYEQNVLGQVDKSLSVLISIW